MTNVEVIANGEEGRSLMVSAAGALIAFTIQRPGERAVSVKVSRDEAQRIAAAILEAK